jgi:hypothetical protein
MRAGDIAPNPLNWRRHSPAQIKAMQGILREVGYAGALLAREESDGAVVLIDGHLRQALNPDQIVPVLILDVTEEESRKVLATYDPISTMAEADADAFAALVESFDTTDADMRQMIDEQMAAFYEDATSSDEQEEEGEVVADPNAEWVGMPEFSQEDKTAFRSLHVHFKDQAAVDAFAGLVGQQITEHTRFLWYPSIEIETYADKRYINADADSA